MGVFNETFLIDDTFTSDTIEELMEQYAYDDLCKLTDEQRTAFLESEDAKYMVEAGRLRNKTLVRLSKNDDLSRRIKMACLQMAKENDDTLYIQLAKNRVKEKELLSKITQKYQSRATRVAKVAQKEYIKNNRVPIPFIKK